MTYLQSNNTDTQTELINTDTQTDNMRESRGDGWGQDPPAKFIFL